MSKVIISGDRNWNGHELESKMRAIFSQFPKDTEIIHGNCRGVDLTADKIARELGLKITIFSPDWKNKGKAAGPIRNKEMLDYGATAVYAFHQYVDESKGTKNMMDQAKKRNVPVYLFG